MKTLSIVGLLLFAVVGCGQKGPLYMPHYESNESPSQANTNVNANTNTNTTAKPAVNARKMEKSKSSTHE